MQRILLVEDDEPLAMGVEFSLINEGFEIKTAKSIKEAQELFNLELFHLILLDVLLPDGMGYELCKNIRIKSDIPIIFLTACDEEANIVLGLDIGGDDYITKPFKLKELVSRIKAALRRAQKENSSIEMGIHSKKISVYPMETRVCKNGMDISLTTAEYKLLVLLLQNPLQTISRETILDKLWDIEGDFINDNTLSVFIRRLREKLEEDPSHPEYIITVRGVGYKWNQRSNFS